VRWRDTPAGAAAVALWTLAGHFLAMLLVWLAAAPASVDRPAGLWGAHAGGTYRTRAAELVRPAADLAAPTGAKRLELPAPDASGTRSRALTRKEIGGPSCVLSCASYWPCCCRLPHWRPRLVELSVCRVHRPPLRGVTSKLRLPSRPRLTARPV
jgi:hypothetical protein